MATSNWDKFLLLMWKNWLLQWRHKIPMIIEILIPVVFSALLVLIRSLVEAEIIPEPTTYPPLPINIMEPLRTSIPINYTLIYSPKNERLHQLVEAAAFSLEMTGAIGFDTPDEMERAFYSVPYLAGIDFHTNQNINELPRNLVYSLRFPAELRSPSADSNWRTNQMFPRFQLNGPRNRYQADGGTPGYYREGFLAIQNAIASQYLMIQTNLAQTMPTILLQRYPYPPYIDDVLLTGLQTLLSLIIMLSFLYPCINTVRFIATEKEKQLKEAMKIMGLPNWLHWTGWFVRSMIFMILSISLIVMLVKIPLNAESSVAVFTYSEWSTLWVFLFVYSIVTVTFCFMLSVFFSKAKTAAAVAGLAWFVFYAAFIFTDQSYEEMPLWQKLLLCLLSNTGMAFGFELIIQLESTGEGLQWSNMFEPVTVDDSLTVGYVALMLLVAAGLYMLIALYIEQVFPGQYGVPMKWYFPFTRSFWFGSSTHDKNTVENTKHSVQNPENFEENPKHLNAGIQTRSLRKIYSNDKVAVQSLTLNMYDDQITVLLGHNGAGKTTTMSILTGMFPPSSGTAIINGNDIRTDIDSVRSSLGLCPQHNILFDELTVREHIVFYSRLKGLDNDAVEREVNKYVKLIDLEPKINALSSTLSGGMKRKLSVCIAFCGGSKVVLCDEPTSGMDPAARRALWDVLHAEKKGRTVLLSTHFMDEADVLGDRIAIMANGELKCSGSSYFLKKKFGIGYHLICVKGTKTNSEQITNLLRKYVPDAKIENDIGSELSYQLSDVRSDVFQEMFAELETNMKDLGVESYGVSLTTLEEVFMKVGTDPNPEPKLRDKALIPANGDDFGSDLTLDYAEDVYLMSGFNLAVSQVVALFKKKAIQTIRSWKLLFIQILIPAMFIVITVLSGRSSSVFTDLPALPIQLSSYLESVTILETSPNAVTDSFESRFATQYNRVVMASASANSIGITMHGGMQDYILRLSETILVLINRKYMVGASVLEPGIITAWFNNQPFHVPPLSVGLVHNAVIRTHLGEDFSIDITNAPLPYTYDTRILMVQTQNFGSQLPIYIAFAMAFVAAFYVMPYVKERESRSKLLQMVSGARVHTFWLTAVIWDYFTYILTVLVMVAVFAAFQESGWSTPLELGRFLAILAAFGLCVLPITYIASMFFKSPESGFTLMAMLYVFTGVACFLIVFIMSLQIYDLVHIADALKWIFMLFPHFALSSSLNNINLILQAEELCSVRCEMDPFCTRELMCTFLPTCCENNYFQWEEPGIGRNLIYMLAVGLVAFVWLLLVEYQIVAALVYKLRSYWSTVPQRISEETVDSDVLKEMYRVKAMTNLQIDSQSLVMRDMSKVYGKFMAVNQLSVGVDASECFGLLGINGAGKTSTFKMLTGDEIITSGEAWVRGFSLKANMNSVNKIIGYCPQFDALIGEMTGRETLEMFCRLRGVPVRNIHSTSVNLAVDLNFIKHIDKRVNQFSGGNKRKLSTAVALIGNPVVVFLDEPTTGMDPGAKRQLWDMICKIRKTGKSIVLTSHSMDECEALCTRLAIMVNGEFKCLGSVQHLKNKFGKGFTLTIKLRKPDQTDGMQNGLVTSTTNDALSDVQEYISRNFAGSFLKEKYQELLIYYIPENDLKWSTMFGLMQEAKQRFNIEDYSLSQTSLEQVFLAFAKHQKDVAGR